MKKRFLTLLTVILILLPSQSLAAAFFDHLPEDQRQVLNEKKSTQEQQFEQFKTAKLNWRETREQHQGKDTPISQTLLQSQAQTLNLKAIQAMIANLELNKAQFEYSQTISQEVKETIINQIDTYLVYLQDQIELIDQESIKLADLIGLAPQINAFWQEAVNYLRLITNQAQLEKLSETIDTLDTILAAIRQNFEEQSQNLSSAQKDELAKKIDQIQSNLSDLKIGLEVIDSTLAIVGQDEDQDFFVAEDKADLRIVKAEIMKIKQAILDLTQLPEQPES